MYNLRLAEENDVDAVLEMGRKFYTTTAHAKMIPFDDDSAAIQIFHMLDNGFIILAETEEKELVGMIGCAFFDFALNRAYQGCSEVMFWLEEGHRGGTLAARLIKESEAIAIHEGATFCVMSALETSPEMIETFYKRMGYNRSERAFIKGV